MSQRMVAYRMLAWSQPPELVEVDVPEPGAGEVRVKVAGNGLCHSDLTMMQMPAEIGEALGWSMPFTLGHEIAGWIDGVGPGVSGVRNGDAVALVSPRSCGACSFCLRGRDSACPQGTVGRGYGRDGGLAGYVVATAPRDVIPLRRLDPGTAGPLTDAGATSYHAVSRVRSRLGPGSWAVVIGVGGLGAFAVQFLRVLTPARVIAVDSNPARLAFAEELGVPETIAGVDGATVGRVRELTGGEGAAAVIDFVGTDDTIAAGLSSVRATGAFALVGTGGGTFRRPWYGGLPREAEVFTFQGSTIADVHEVVALADAGLVRNEVDVFSLGDVENAYDRLEHGGLRGRAVVVP